MKCKFCEIEMEHDTFWFDGDWSRHIQYKCPKCKWIGGTIEYIGEWMG